MEGGRREEKGGREEEGGGRKREGIASPTSSPQGLTTKGQNPHRRVNF